MSLHFVILLLKVRVQATKKDKKGKPVPVTGREGR
jgi:hypothetical protein